MANPQKGESRSLERRSVKGRFDFKFDVVEANKEELAMSIRAYPDPRRYDKIEFDGKPAYLDRYLKFVISLDEMSANMAGLPIFVSPRTIDSTNEYADERSPAIDRQLQTGKYEPPSKTPRQQPELKDHPDELDMAFISVDICGSTTLRASNSSDFDRSYKLMIQEIGALVGHFHGAILKTTGDGLIIYMSLPSFTVTCDSAVDLGLSILVLMRESVNPSLKKIGLPPLHIRIGADYGPARVSSIDVPATGFSQIDMASDALNRAKKIESSCEPSKFRIGRCLYELVHVQYLERSCQVDFDGRMLGVEDYEVYEMM